MCELRNRGTRTGSIFSGSPSRSNSWLEPLFSCRSASRQPPRLAARADAGQQNRTCHHPSNQAERCEVGIVVPACTNRELMRQASRAASHHIRLPKCMPLLKCVELGCGSGVWSLGRHAVDTATAERSIPLPRRVGSFRRSTSAAAVTAPVMIEDLSDSCCPMLDRSLAGRAGQRQRHVSAVLPSHVT
jgi:hypothetical protein